MAKPVLGERHRLRGNEQAAVAAGTMQKCMTSSQDASPPHLQHPERVQRAEAPQTNKQQKYWAIGLTQFWDADCNGRLNLIQSNMSRPHLDAGPLGIILGTLQADAPHERSAVGQQLFDQGEVVIQQKLHQTVLHLPLTWPLHHQPTISLEGCLLFHTSAIL